jgi:hypothetical protein
MYLLYFPHSLLFFDPADFPKLPENWRKQGKFDLGKNRVV